ncbi:hypothetical protein [Vibrio nigripulchritudo]|uniref:hypothetical protein n=1 Tax=Vibrio nigripulchritudo TaxID=28173 RepID=UPI002490D726|nr:hypothetical protein [Vibrio nigripulchritudo]BDU40098.1 hypothetical protein TUMSATVNIG2_45670 [Vibrio nigripulchritudo]BDU45822.1 hypothetical protein TUMSATVNIG3_46200 [Vibrio nigripulchritudo]
MILDFKFPYSIYWALFFVFVGIWIAPFVNVSEIEEEDHSSHYTHDHSMSHKRYEVAESVAPKIELELLKDTKSGWNLILHTSNFEFTPEKVNQSNQPNQGHAHLYVNGEKITRLYGKYFYLSDFPVGEHEVVVNLNTNDHSEFSVNGEVIEARVKLIQVGDKEKR